MSKSEMAEMLPEMMKNDVLKSDDHRLIYEMTIYWSSTM